MKEVNLDKETIELIGLKVSDKHINAQIAPESRIFDYPKLKDVYVMESDLYGNKMPNDSCFLAFYGQHGLIGKHMKVEALRNASIQDINCMVEENNEG